MTEVLREHEYARLVGQEAANLYDEATAHTHSPEATVTLHSPLARTTGVGKIMREEV